MSRDVIPFTVADISAFSKTLRTSLEGSDPFPTHTQFLGLVAKAAGYQNYQHLRAELTGEIELNEKRLKEALRVFDAQGRMHHWPKKYSIRALSLWVFWSRMPRKELSEPEVNAILIDGNTFGDHVLLRRELIDHGLMTRTPNGSAYRKVEKAPPPEAQALIRRLKGRG